LKNEHCRKYKVLTGLKFIVAVKSKSKFVDFSLNEMVKAQFSSLSTYFSRPC